ncbi:ABC transporter ATP-binding protein [Peptoniphilus equinus]|uniref:ABC transporter ATP-binding protein n=1 Tax=Peptoniphilus equinus TaxID=3016343 RepID=A0ABY7QSN4_9FIRM|nr:ABC transporter ATP-binding protein [Peptoniphilus equinus]WBW49336.1 ABC transporter ATP-binding protein [Peptoniphilus equinus]
MTRDKIRHPSNKLVPLSIDDLTVTLLQRQDPVLQHISVELHSGEILGIIGESGAGKSMLCKSIMGLLPDSLVTGRITLCGVEMVHASETLRNTVRGKKVGMVLQDPSSSLVPTMTVGRQLQDALRRHHTAFTREGLYDKAIELMALVGFQDPELWFHRYPHELSGGMCQRMVVAIALCGDPEVLLCDEPTTALDAMTKVHMARLFLKLKATLGISIVIVSHDRDLIQGIADRVAVMHRGELTLLRSNVDGTEYKSPSLERLVPHEPTLVMDDSDTPLIKVSHLSHHFALEEGPFQALNNVSFDIKRGEIFGLVGESGSGKSTVAACVMNLLEPTSGTIIFDGMEISNCKVRRQHQKSLARSRHIIFQDSADSLNPRMTVQDIISEPLKIQKLAPKRGTYRDEAAFQLRYVGLDAGYLQRRPYELSGGERQRVAIARAVVAEPKLLIADEAVSSLDVAVQGQIMELLAHLRASHGFAILFIAHDLGAVRHLCDRVGVMVGGRLVETDKTDVLFSRPKHDYTKALLRSALWGKGDYDG